MVSILDRTNKAHCRIIIRDIITGKSLTISLRDHEKIDIKEIKKIIIDCLNR